MQFVNVKNIFIWQYFEEQPCISIVIYSWLSYNVCGLDLLYAWFKLNLFLFYIKTCNIILCACVSNDICSFFFFALYYLLSQVIIWKVSSRIMKIYISCLIFFVFLFLGAIWAQLWQHYLANHPKESSRAELPPKKEAPC